MKGDKNMNEWRRFKLVSPEKGGKLNKLIDEKKITRDDLIFIFSTLKLTEQSFSGDTKYQL